MKSNVGYYSMYIKYTGKSILCSCPEFTYKLGLGSKMICKLGSCYSELPVTKRFHRTKRSLTITNDLNLLQFYVT